MIDQPTPPCPSGALRRGCRAFRRGGLTVALPCLLLTMGCTLGAEAIPSARGATLDPVQEELAAGRNRKAALLLRERLQGRPDTSAADLLTLARAEEGWGNAAAARRLLEGRPWLDDREEGAGWEVLARAAEQEGRWAAAADGWARRWAAGGDEVARLRWIRALARAGDGRAALDELGRGIEGVATPWLALQVATVAAPSGDTSVVRLALERAGEEVGARGGQLSAMAALAAGDSSGALREWRRWAEAAPDPPSRASALAEAGTLALARGDTAGAEADFRRAMAVGGSPVGARRAARALVRGGRPLDREELIRSARLLALSGESRLGAEAWDRAEAVGPLTPEERLARARLLRPVDAERARAELDVLGGLDDPAVAAPALELLVALHRSREAESAARAAEERVVSRHAGTAEALDVVFFRADAAHDEGDLEAAAAGYGRAAAMSPSRDRAGLARMRHGQLLLTLGRPAEALAVFEGYLQDFPRGRRWDEAAYWAARIRREGGDPDGAAPLLRRIRQEDPLGYHAVLADRLEGRPFEPELAASTGEAGAPPTWMVEGLDGVDLLLRAGLEEGARQARVALERRADSSVPDLLLLAEGLHRVGLHLEGVNVGWEARRLGHPWDLRLARILYPLPRRELVFREAADQGLDPFLVAAVIRQESAFVADAVSPAGAVGLMQVLPPGAPDLARDAGVEPYREELLRNPEIGVLLGTRYLRELLGRYDGSLPLALAAYNAGPSRAARWSAFPEASDHERFVERIPFAETRGYVRNVTRNAVVYRWLYP